MPPGESPEFSLTMNINGAELIALSHLASHVREVVGYAEGAEALTDVVDRMHAGFLLSGDRTVRPDDEHVFVFSLTAREESTLREMFAIALFAGMTGYVASMPDLVGFLGRFAAITAEAPRAGAL